MKMNRKKYARSSRKRKVVIIGAGRVGTALGLALKEKGYPIVGVGVVGATGRSPLQSARRGAKILQAPVFTPKPLDALKEAGIILITTPDREIEKVARTLSRSGILTKETLVIHTSGAFGVEILDPLKNFGVSHRMWTVPLRLAMHPLQTFSKPITNYSASGGPMTNFQGCYFALDGNRKALRIGKKIVKDLGGIPIFIPGGKRVLYHTGASIASNYLVSLMDLALQVLEEIGISQKKGFNMLLPIIQGTLKNIEAL